MEENDSQLSKETSQIQASSTPPPPPAPELHPFCSSSERGRTERTEEEKERETEGKDQCVIAQQWSRGVWTEKIKQPTRTTAERDTC